MAVKLGQYLKQTQNLMMTPQLQQAIKLLTLTHLEMSNVIAEEMVENPMLEEAGDNDSKKEEDYKVEKLEMDNKEAESNDFEAPSLMERDDFDWSNYLDNYNSNSSTPPSMVSRDPDEQVNYENIVSSEEGLTEHLEWQLRMMDDMSEQEWEIANQIIYNIGASGYLEADFDEIISLVDASEQEALEVLRKIQQLDPIGCGSRNLKECLLIQAELEHERSPLVELFIESYLPLLQKKSYEKISKEIGVTVEKIQVAEQIIQSFHPRPGRLVSAEQTHYIIPDIYVEEVGGEFVVNVNNEGIPRLKISKLYQTLLKQQGNKDTSKEAQEFVQEKMRSALWLIKSIQNRQSTILKVAKSIVRRQQMFFKKGAVHLKPMVLRDIAGEIGMHESTVSRVTTNKYMHTPIGIFELKYFFNAGVGGKDGGIDISGEVLKLKLKTLIKNENSSRPYSDQKLADLLSREDVKVARRTVAKYRETLGILSSSKRKVK